MTDKYINRAITAAFTKSLLPQKVLILLGARRVGKSEFLQEFLKEYNTDDYLLLNGEDQNTIDAFSERSVANFKRVFANKKLIVIDEAQHIPEIGAKLKIIVDGIKPIKIIVTGSSVFDLSNKLGEPLVGREKTIQLFPLAQMELNNHENFIETKSKLEERLIYGSYPELEKYTDVNDKASYLESLVNSYLLRDVLTYEGVRRSDKIMSLLRLVALQVGQEVKPDELALQLKGISRNTVDKYLDLLSKVFIIYKLNGYSKNLRKEITKSCKWYFYDNGIRNAIIRNFNKPAMRTDKGAMWENYLMSERLKYNAYNNKRVNMYFWRTYDQQEIDLVEEEAGKLSAYEFKWQMGKKVKAPGGWKSAYPKSVFSVIDTSNYLNFIT